MPGTGLGGLPHLRGGIGHQRRARARVQLLPAAFAQQRTHLGVRVGGPAREILHQARAANAKLRPCWTCRGSIGGQEDSELELTEKAGPNRLECPGCEQDRQEEELGPLVLPAPAKCEQMAALVSTPTDPWWDVRVLHAKFYPAKERAA
ncbi:hypothetical protein ACFV4P_35125 [Kitasatospora sp. NPDC059795]|uniref:hypothetical protein n=1 Tax=Kitasatospora sp. NPDC059795 TaxID=3346949 RepID=UPI003663446A